MRRDEIVKFSKRLLTIANQYLSDDAPFDVSGPELIYYVTDWGFTICGFDNTEMRPNTWQFIMDKFGLKYLGTMREVYPEEGWYREDSDYNGGFVWANDSIRVVTGNNPITGEYVAPSMRDPEPNYVGKIGIEGISPTVGEIAKAILQNASYVKQFEPGERSFI